jgi:hypothetical protein
MPGKRTHPSKASAEKPDDFQLIEGINEAIETELKEVGITTFSQLAAQSPADVAAAISRVEKVSNTRVKSWIRQAEELANPIPLEPASEVAIPKEAEEVIVTKSAEAAPPEPISEIAVVQRAEEVVAPEVAEEVIAPARLEPAAEAVIAKTVEKPFVTILLKLYLSDDNRVNQTQVTHSRNLTGQTWDGWDAAHLEDFLTGQFQLHLPEPKAARMQELAAITKSEVEVSAQVEGVAGLMETETKKVETKEAEIAEAKLEIAVPVQPKKALEKSGEVKPVILGQDESYAVSAVPVKPRVNGKAQITNLYLAGIAIDRGSVIITGSRPYTISMLLDLSRLETSGKESLNYTVTLYAKMLGGERQVAGEAKGKAASSNLIDIRVQGNPLLPGTYLLEVIVTLSDSATETGTRPSHMAWQEAGLIQVV